MVSELIAAVRSLIEGDPAVRRVADDPALTAELLLLFRVILADGHVSQDELDEFRRICRESFDIGDESFADVMAYLKDYGYETGSREATAVFAELDIDRRRLLASHVAEIAKADGRLDVAELRIISRIADTLGLAPEDFRPSAA